MSTFEAKVEVVYDFLANRASLKRLTNTQEVANVAGYTLKNRQERRIDSPVRRDKITKVLAAVDRKSFAEKGVLLSATVAHFWDNEVSRYFYKRAAKKGVTVGGGRGGSIYGVSGITAYRDQVFAAYTGTYAVSQKPKPIERNYDRFYAAKADAARRNDNSINLDSGSQRSESRLGSRYADVPTADRGEVSDGLQEFQERLQALTVDFDNYVGRHRARV
jgi:hypothetical protein